MTTFVLDNRCDTDMPGWVYDLGGENGTGRSLLPSLLCPIDPSARTARGTVLRTTLVPDNAAATLATTTCGDLRVAGSHGYCVPNQRLDGGWLRDASRLRRDDICSRIRALTIEFSSGVRLRKSI
jgi:hypothetical protein